MASSHESFASRFRDCASGAEWIVRVFFPHDSTIQANAGSCSLVCCWLRDPHVVASLSSPSRLGFILKRQSCAHSRTRLARLPGFDGFFQHEKAPRLREGLFLGEGLWARRPVSQTDGSYLGCCCWSIVEVAGAEELLESCSRSFFSRLTSTRPPLMCLPFSFSSAPATGALPMPTR